MSTKKRKVHYSSSGLRGGDFVNVRVGLPEVGQRVMVNCQGFRVVGYLNAEGEWHADVGEARLEGVISWKQIHD